MEDRRPERFRARRFISVVAALAMLAVTLSGVVLFIKPPGWYASTTGWGVLGLQKGEWEALHVCFSLLLVVAAFFHLAINWRAFLGYFRRRLQGRLAWRREWVLALLCSGALFVAVRAGLPPFATILQARSEIKHGWARRRATLPQAQGESMTLAGVAGCRASGHQAAPCDSSFAGDVNAVLFRGPPALPGGAGAPDGECGAARGGGPTACDSPPLQASPSAAEARALHGRGQGQGLGRQTLAAVCRDLGLDPDEAVKRLQDAGMRAAPDLTMREIAATGGRHPRDLRGIIAPANGR